MNFVGRDFWRMLAKLELDCDRTLFIKNFFRAYPERVRKAREASRLLCFMKRCVFMELKSFFLGELNYKITCRFNYARPRINFFRPLMHSFFISHFEDQLFKFPIFYARECGRIKVF